MYPGVISGHYNAQPGFYSFVRHHRQIGYYGQMGHLNEKTDRGFVQLRLRLLRLLRRTEL